MCQAINSWGWALPESLPMALGMAILLFSTLAEYTSFVVTFATALKEKGGTYAKLHRHRPPFRQLFQLAQSAGRTRLCLALTIMLRRDSTRDGTAVTQHISLYNTFVILDYYL